MKTRLLLLVIAWVGLRCHGDDFVMAPTPNPAAETGSMFPFLIKQMGNTPTPTMRYQQVYNATLFSNVNPANIFVTTLTIFLGNNVIGWTVPSMQINLSTTAKSAASLSLVFGENVGMDDTVVFGPHSNLFPGGLQYAEQPIHFDRPFRYNPILGNLLLDVRVFDGSGFIDPRNPSPALDAYSSPTDEVARAWATNVTASAASGADTLGLFTVIQFSPVPSLTNGTYTCACSPPTNFVIIDWPNEPAGFVLQRSARLGSAASWQTVTNAGTGPNTSFQRYFFPANSAGYSGFYRLVWPGGP